MASAAPVVKTGGIGHATAKQNKPHDNPI